MGGRTATMVPAGFLQILAEMARCVRRPSEIRDSDVAAPAKTVNVAPMAGRSTLVLLALAMACHRDPPPPPGPGVPGDPRFVPPVYTDAAAVTVTLPSYRVPGKLLEEDTSVAATSKTSMIVTEREIASKIGRDMLAAGGTAVDAAVASAFALAVVHPSRVGIGGGGFAIVRTAPGKAIAIDFRGTGQAPGFVAGLASLHGKYGKRPWREVVAPAIALARDGFAIDRRTSALLGAAMDRLERSPASAAIWTVGGAAHDEGARVVLAELSTTLEQLANDPEAVAALANAAVIRREPLRFTYRGHAIATLPAPSEGGARLAAVAAMLGGVDLGSLAWHGADHVHWLVEVWKRGFALGAATPPDVEQQLASITDQASASPDVDIAYDDAPGSPLSVVDRTGLAVAMTLTLGAPFGTGETIAGGYLRALDPPANAPSLMAPYVVENVKGEVVLVGAAAGGREGVTAAWQVLSNVIDFAHRGSLAVNNPRVHHQQRPDTVFVEDFSIDRDTDTKLVERGHAIDWNRSPREFGIVNAIVRTKTGWDAAADTRGGGKAIGD